MSHGHPVSLPQCPPGHSGPSVTANEGAPGTVTSLTSVIEGECTRWWRWQPCKGEGVARLLSHQGQWAACRVRCDIPHTVRLPDTQVSSTLLLAERSFPSYRTSLGTQTRENRYAPTIVSVFSRRKRPQAVTSHGIGAQPGITVTRHLPQSCPATPRTRTVS